jgi:hypothetical protein
MLIVENSRSERPRNSRNVKDLTDGPIAHFPIVVGGRFRPLCEFRNVSDRIDEPIGQ